MTSEDSSGFSFCVCVCIVTVLLTAVQMWLAKVESMQCFNEEKCHLILNVSYDHVFDVHFHVFPLLISL